MLKVTVKASRNNLPEVDPSGLQHAFNKKNMPKLFRYIEVATKRALGDKSSLPHFYGRTAFYDDKRQLTGKSGPNLIQKFKVRTEETPNGAQLVISNTKMVGNYNLFWMLTDGTKSYWSGPKFMTFFDRYGNRGGTGPGFRCVRFRRGNQQFVPLFNNWIDQQAQAGTDKGVQAWEMSGAAQKEIETVLRKSVFKR